MISADEQRHGCNRHFQTFNQEKAPVGAGPHLYGGWVGVMEGDGGCVGGVDGELDPDERLDAVWVGGAGAAHQVAEAPGAGVDVEGVLHDARLAAQEHHVEGGVAAGRDHLQGN